MSDDVEDEPVGYCRPPRRTRFRKGQTGNPGGRPKTRGTVAFDLDKLLDRSMAVKIDGEPRVMQSKEVELRQLVDRAIKKQDLAAIGYLLELFVTYRAIEPPPKPYRSPVAIVPNTLPFVVGIAAADELGSPPWKKKDLDPIKARYLETRSEIDRIVDEIMEYDL